MPRIPSCLLIAVAAFTLITASVAQAPSTKIATASSDGIPAKLVTGTINNSCPVALLAKPGVGPGMVVIVDGNNTASQQLNLQLTNLFGMWAITHAQITVHGLTAKGAIDPAIFGMPGTPTIAKQVDLALNVAPGANVSTSLLFKGFTSVSWIDLDSLTYAGGSAWHASPQHACRIEPSRVMLVARH